MIGTSMYIFTMEFVDILIISIKKLRYSRILNFFSRFKFIRNSTILRTMILNAPVEMLR